MANKIDHDFATSFDFALFLDGNLSGPKVKEIRPPHRNRRISPLTPEQALALALRQIENGSLMHEQAKQNKVELISPRG